MDNVESTQESYQKYIVLPSVDANPPPEHKEEEILSTTLVSNGSVDIRGRIADKRTTGGWKASPFIIVNEVAERLAFTAIAVSMVSYLVLQMNESVPQAATLATNWVGAAFVLTILGAFLADAYLGRFKTIIYFSSIYGVGMIMLTISGSIDSFRPPKCTTRPCTPASSRQKGFLYGALTLIALGTGGIKPCVSSFGADQFDEADEKELVKKYSFFNWFFFAINMGALLGITVLMYLAQEKGTSWGFAVPTVAMFCSIFILAAGIPYYRYQKPMGSAFTRFLQVIVVAVRNHMNGVQVDRQTVLYEVDTKESDIFGARKLSHTAQYGLLDKAAVKKDPETNTKNRWKLCTVTQVEEFKSFIRVLPIWASTIALSISFSQNSTFFISQATLANRKLGSNFVIPVGSVPVFASANAIILVPIYEALIVPMLRKKTGHRRGITSLQRMGVGLFVSIFAMVSAALVEKMRRDQFPNPGTMSVFWLLPQYFLMGTAEVFTYVGQLEFFYDEATDGTRSLSSAFFLSEIGIGSWLCTAIVKIIQATTGGEEKGWLRNNLNQSKLDSFYWMLTAINALNFLVYMYAAWSYKGRDGAGSMPVGDEAMVEMHGQLGKDADKGEFERKVL